MRFFTLAQRNIRRTSQSAVTILAMALACFVMVVFAALMEGWVYGSERNAVLMRVLERAHEFGIIRAIGVTPWQIIGLIYSEAMLQTLLAAIIGGLSGGLTALHLQQHGIDMSTIASTVSFAGIALDPIWYAYVTPAALWQPVVKLDI
jgi:ABC-type lipoprotein release transport system permease subunit